MRYSNHKPEVDMRFRRCPASVFAVLGSGQHIFQQTSTKFRTEYNLNNADFVLSGE